MAIPYFGVRHISRPRDAVEAAAYRAGERLEHNGKIYDYTRRHDIIHSEIFLPENAPSEFSDRLTLWLAAEKAEDSSTRWKTARTAHEIILALQRELTFDTSIITVKELITKHLVPQGMCVDFNVHRGDRKDGSHHIEGDHKDISPHNPHCHLQCSTRHVGPEGFNKYKAREWEHWGDSAPLTELKKEWADIQNRMFERKGLPNRVSFNRSIERENEHEHGWSR